MLQEYPDISDTGKQLMAANRLPIEQIEATLSHWQSIESMSSENNLSKLRQSVFESGSALISKLQALQLENSMHVSLAKQAITLK